MITFYLYGYQDAEMYIIQKYFMTDEQHEHKIHE